MHATAVLDIVPEAISHFADDLTQTPMPVKKLQPFADSSPCDPFPTAGDEFYGYELVEELGQGAFARVFLARERRLANRLVVLKIAAKPSNEPLRLARLQHTNIVPIQTAFRAGPFQVVQMPYHGRQTLASVIEYVRISTGFPEVSGDVFTTAAQLSTHRESKVQSTPQLLPVIEAKSRTETGIEPTAEIELLDTHPLREMLTEMSYTRAVLSLMRRIADGLAHAHFRNILHLDLKPHNILFGDDGQPMLLDFNLSRDRTTNERKRVGGTWPYMSPEAIREYANLSDEKSDERTDLFALGVIFYELLTCRLPFSPIRTVPEDLAPAVAERENFVPNVREFNPEVPHAVEAIIAKLLAPKPENRYRTVDELREDLQRQEESRPLKYAADTNIVERFDKWRHRNPGMVVRILAVVVACTMAAGAFAFQSVQTSKNQMVAKEQAREFQTGLATARFDVSFPTDRPTRQDGMAALAKLLKSYAVGETAHGVPVDKLNNLTPTDRKTMLSNLREAALLLAHGEIMESRSQAGAERAASLERARNWNSHAEELSSDDRPASLWEQRKELATLLDDPRLAATIPADAKSVETTEELYLRAVAQVGRGDFPAAIRTATQLTLLAPDHYAGHALLGSCYHCTAQPQLAIERYLVARPLAKAGKMSLYNRAMILHSLRKFDLAEADLTALIEMAPRDHRGYTLRATVREHSGKHREAVADYTAALATGGPAILLYNGRADCYAKLAEEAAAKLDREKARSTTPTTPEEFVYLGNRLLPAKPTEAIQHYNEALKLNPEYILAYQNKTAAFADHLGEWDLALEVQERIRAIAPHYVPGFAARGILYARLGKRTESIREIEQALQRSQEPNTLYQAACVYAVLAKDDTDDLVTARKYLRQAVRQGYRNADGMEKDSDLKLLWDDAEFRSVVQLVRDIVK